MAPRWNDRLVARRERQGHIHVAAAIATRLPAENVAEPALQPLVTCTTEIRRYAMSQPPGEIMSDPIIPEGKGGACRTRGRQLRGQKSRFFVTRSSLIS